jgi:anti-sigma B factor antagonist
MDADYDYSYSAWFFTVTGDLDMAAEPTLREIAEFADLEPTSTVWINLSRVGFIDCAGLAALIGIRNTADAAHRVLILEDPSEPVCRLLELTGLTAHFRISSTCRAIA